MLKMRLFWIFIILAAVCLAAVVIASRKGSHAQANTNPVRIVSLSPQLTEIMYSLGLEDRIAAVSQDSDYPPAVKQKTTVGSFFNPSTEAIIAVKPDLVVVEKFEQQQNVSNRLEQMGYPVLKVQVDYIRQLFEAIETIGKATNTQAEAQKLLNDIKSKLINISGPVSKNRKSKVLWVVQNNPVRVAGTDTFVNEIIELAGGKNAIGPTVQKYPPVGLEEIISCKPDIIIQPAHSSSSVADEQKIADEFWSKWPSVPAVKNKRVYVISPDEVLRLGPRIDKGIEIIARCIHPKVFEEKTAVKEQNGQTTDSKVAGN
jgi:iron complex transport system substrate-binding protein